MLGGSRGIGATNAQLLAEDGADVAITSQRAAQKAEAVVKRTESRGLRAPLRVPWRA
ncbi:hypothetical protein [Phenylobacterium sp. LjRoot225]|uniref:hypothetical protein n=1 Tax=Phenylobacterium sp. LjRoot225 TaxID=3342285 RepID=UPI003F505031